MHTWVMSALQYLKSIRLERNRKTGFKCPRGCGKGSAHKEPCPGKIDKSHPIHPRNEEQKKKKKVIAQQAVAGAMELAAAGQLGQVSATVACSMQQPALSWCCGEDWQSLHTHCRHW
eukprot:GHRQ01034734.1.p2 GENE.GHRQ01034734.1~~GHRQ01034734.1.p2  ORF type:complete len:117 (-),score=34.63 GHRQ01034734.1:231-581(-)